MLQAERDDYRELSYWHDSLGPDALVPRAPLPGDTRRMSRSSAAA
jgi:hypothetical protein